MWERLKATGRAIKHRRLTFALVVAFLAIGVVGGLYAIQDGATFSGQTQAGDHDWYQDYKGAGQANCENCHTAVAADLNPATGGEHKSASQSMCSYCHTPGGTDHAASPAKCADCHASDASGDDTKAINLTNDAHDGIMTSLGEDSLTASQTCISCHTHAEISMTIYADAPIPLQMGTTTTTAP